MIFSVSATQDGKKQNNREPSVSNCALATKARI